MACGCNYNVSSKTRGRRSERKGWEGGGMQQRQLQLAIVCAPGKLQAREGEAAASGIVVQHNCNWP